MTTEYEGYEGPMPSVSRNSAPVAIYVWLVPSEEVLEQPGSWRIRKWDTEPFPEANYTARSETQQSNELRERLDRADAARFRWLCRHWDDFSGYASKDPTRWLMCTIDAAMKAAHGCGPNDEMDWP